MNPLLLSLMMGELIPTTPGAQDLLNRGLTFPGQAGDAIRLLHAQPEKVYLSDYADPLQRARDWLFGLGSQGGTMGSFMPNLTGQGYNMYMNVPKFEVRDRNLARPARESELMKTFGHESGHGLAQITGKGGTIDEPTGSAIARTIGLMGRGVVEAFGGPSSLRIDRSRNEALADAISGANLYGLPLASDKLLAAQVLQSARNRLTTQEGSLLDALTGGVR